MSRRVDFEPAMEDMDWEQRVSFLKTAGPLMVDHTTRTDLIHNFASSLEDGVDHRRTCKHGDVEVSTSVPKDRSKGLDDAIVKTLAMAEDAGADVIDVATELRDGLGSMHPSDYGQNEDLGLKRVPSDTMKEYIDGGLRWPLTQSEWTELGLFLDSISTMVETRDLHVDIRVTKGAGFDPELHTEDEILNGAATLELFLHISHTSAVDSVSEALKRNGIDEILELIDDAHKFTHVCNTDRYDRWAEKHVNIHCMSDDEFRDEQMEVGVRLPLHLSVDPSRVQQLESNEYAEPGR